MAAALVENVVEHPGAKSFFALLPGGQDLSPKLRRFVLLLSSSTRTQRTAKCAAVAHFALVCRICSRAPTSLADFCALLRAFIRLWRACMRCT